MEVWKPVSVVLNRFSIKDLLTTVTQLEIFPNELHEELKDFTGNKRKKEIVDTLIGSLKESNDANTALGHLDLFSCYRKSTQRTWTVFELLNKNDDVDKLIIEPEDLEADLMRKLNSPHINSTVSIQLHDGAHWLRVNMSDKTTRRRRKKRISNTYCVYFHGTNSIAIAGLTKYHSTYLFEALGSVFDFESTKQTALQDRNLIGILQLFNEKKNTPFFHAAKVQEPLTILKVPTIPIKEFNEKIINLERKNTIARKRYNEGVFGTDEIPVVKKLVYEIETPFAGLEHIPQMRKNDKKSFHCQVVFEGSSVIEGFENLIKAGIMKMPLPNYMAEARTMGRTKYLIGAKNLNRE